MHSNKFFIVGSFMLLTTTAVSTLFVSGCASGMNWQTMMKEWGPMTRVEMREEAEAHRMDYQENRSRKAMLWLLTNRVFQGMSVEDVNEAIGQVGELKKQDGFLKRNSPLYRRDDVTYGYGPDEKGRTIYLMFREKKLVNYDPEEYEK